MSDDNKDDTGAAGSEEPRRGARGGDGRREEAPRERVIRTPSPARDKELLAEGDISAPAGAGEQLDEASAKRAERVVATFFLLAFAGSVGFIAYYIGWSGRDGGMHGVDRARESNFWLGGMMALSFLALAIGVTIWVRRLMTSKPIIQERHLPAADEETRAGFNEDFMEGAVDSGITKRPLLRRTLLLASAPLGLAPLVLLRDLGPLPEKKLRSTFWAKAVEEAHKQGKKGVRLVVDGTNRPLRVSDFSSPGSMITVLPEGIEEHVPEEQVLTETAKAVTILINVPADEFKPAKGRENWHVNGIVAYSKICTHVGCPAALYEQTTHHILCPCHQSTFDATNAAKVVFGPAARPLPQLPLSVEDGYIVATSDYHEPIGPSFWERG
ncbi:MULTISPECIES: ubiquinol-cytochrome c reductase iron-sulfur subunit [Actinomadura]|uniref:Cytochrome bc1 complex Rieske iron-sulfur subunit n=1 Tax=Actinomadura litoris TaxID=2678616 RepID=A0A7K1LBS7_9ACTN|nr:MULTISPECIES: Rieske 2Fe-2S domain-containing protein [Actinomadura]MBT2209666.1 Rieske (2Fe-2S) protein [Actinomadura sp. NEAU-AAG7]MUN41874.1 Rieske 2Fe-2S domain-containing protein [Actinomadura litoris]